MPWFFFVVILFISCSFLVKRVQKGSICETKVASTTKTHELRDKNNHNGQEDRKETFFRIFYGQITFKYWIFCDNHFIVPSCPIILIICWTILSFGRNYLKCNRSFSLGRFYRTLVLWDLSRNKIIIRLFPNRCMMCFSKTG